MALVLNGSGITSANLVNGTIVDEDVADVAASKLTGYLPAIDGSALTGVGPTDSGWIQAASTQGHYGSPYGPIRFRKIGNIVSIQGITTSAVGSSTVFVLPVGYRPPGRIIVATMNNDTAARYDIDPNGNVVQDIVNSNSWFSLFATFIVA